MSLQSQAELLGQEMVKDPASYVAAAATTAPLWLTWFNTGVGIVLALMGVVYLGSKIWGVWLQNKGHALDNEKKKRDANE